MSLYSNNILDHYIKVNGLYSLEVIQHNERKKTQIIKAKKKDKYLIIKLIDKDSPISIKEKFEVEKQFYIKNQYDYTPKLIDFNDDLIVIEFISGKTLLEYLKQEFIEKDVFINLFSSINLLYNNSKVISNDKMDFKNAYSHLSNLFFSGPIQNIHIKTSFSRKFLLKFNLLICRFKLKFYLNQLDESILKAGFIHGDFHYNNILITSDLNVKLIDFENLKFDGSFDFDIMYLYAMIDYNINKDDECYRIVNSQINKLFINPELKKIFELYKYAISKNNRFLVKPK